MHVKRLVATAAIFLSATALHAANIYMTAGKTIYEFNGSGQLITQADDDTVNRSAQGMQFGPDGRLYVAVGGGVSRVDSFSANLTNQVTGFVPSGQGGLAVPEGLTFGPDSNLYVAGNGSGLDRYYGPTSVNPAPGSNNPSPGNAGTALWSSVPNLVGLAYTPDGTLYGSAETGTGRLYRFDPTTGAGTIVASDLTSIAAGAVAINAAGTLLFVRDNSQILEYAINADHSLTKNPAFTVHASPGLDGSTGLAMGPDGFLYATTRTQDGATADFIDKIDPATGNATPFVQGNINTFTNAQNPFFLTFAPSPVPEPSTLVLSVFAGLIGIGAWRRRNAARTSA